MSLEIMNSVWKHSKSQGRARLVLLAIADHQGQMGAWPSIETLADMANASRRSISRDIAELAAMGELQIDERQAPVGGQYRANLYWVLPEIMGSGSDMTKKRSDMTDSTPDMTDWASDMTAQASDMPHSGTLTQRTLKNPKKNEKRPPHFLPDDFEPDAESLALMKSKFPWVDIKLQTYAFKDHWASVSPSKAKKSDWQATWRNWIRRSAEWSKPADTPTKPKHVFGDDES